MIFFKIREAVAKRKAEKAKAWAEFREGIECNKPAECWCPLCDPQSYGGIGPHFGPLFIDHKFTCPKCDAEMTQLGVRDDGSIYCPRCKATL